MTLSRLRWLAVLGALLTVAGARADDALVRDEAGLFSPDAVQQADAEIRAVRDKYHIEFVIETVAAPPDGVKNQLKAAKNNAEKERILDEWGARQADGDAVHILICKDVAHGWFGKVYGAVVVTVPPAARGRDFTDADALALQHLLRWFTSGANRAKNDAILQRATAQVREDLRYNLQPGFPWLATGGVIAGVLAVWGVLRLVRLRMRATDEPEPRRLGLYHALLGGMFGSVAAHWIYDSLFVAESRAAKTVPETAVPLPASEPELAASEGEGSEPPLQTKAERLDLAARDHPAEEEPTVPGPARF